VFGKTSFNITTSWRRMGKIIPVGDFIDHVIRLNHKKSPVEGLTDYIKNHLSVDSGISQRTIGRMRTLNERELPEGESVIKLAQVLSEIEILLPQDLCNRLINSFNSIKNTQKQLTTLSSNHKLHIISGWQPPQALIDDDICASVVDNISKGLKYEYLFPPIESCPYKSNPNISLGGKESILPIWLKNLKSLLEIKWYSQQSSRYAMNASVSKQINDLDNNDIEEARIEFKKKLDENIQFYSTKPDYNFWFILPSPYSVFYNLLKKDVKAEYKIGMFYVNGVPINYPEGEKEIITSQGWLYTSHETYHEIEKEYEKMRKDLVSVTLSK
jgi:hypothetical protein